MSDLADLAATARQLAHVPDAENPPACSINVRTVGLTTTYDSAEEFASDIRDADLPRVESVGIRVGARYRGDHVEVDLAFSAHTGARLTVVGDDRARVEGVLRLLVERLDTSGAGRHVEPFFLGAGASTFCFLMLYAWAAAQPDPPDDDEETLLELVAAGGLMAVLFGIGYGVFKFMSWARPQLELVPRGEKPRWQRVRCRVFGIVATLATIAVGLVAQEVFL